MPGLSDIPIEPQKVEVLPRSIPWIKVKELPSSFLPYPTPCTIEYRPYTWGEVKLLQQPSLSEKEVLQTLLQGIRANFPIPDLAVMDYYFISILRRMSTESEDCSWHLHTICSCEKRQPLILEFSAKDIDINMVGKDVRLPIVLTLNGKEVKFMPLTVGKFMSMEDLVFGKDIEIATIACMVSNMEFTESYDLLWNLSNGEDIEKVDEAKRKLDFGISPIKRSCPSLIDGNSCGKIIMALAHLEVGHLRPFRSVKKPN